MLLKYFILLLNFFVLSTIGTGHGKVKRSFHRLTANDPNSFSNPEQIRVTHMDIYWDVNFNSKIISGSTNYHLEWLEPECHQIVFDSRDLLIKSISFEEKKLDFKFGDVIATMGRPLMVTLPKEIYQKTLQIRIEYETSPNSSALQWLSPEQTLGKRSPYLFSQCQPIHARSLMPCQDSPASKATYNAEVTAPEDLTVLMSAPRKESSGNPRKFEQKVPIPAYLLAIVVGELKGHELGPRSTVWAEEGLLNAAAYEFSDTEKYLETAEKIFTPYVWGIYDILVLPPSFPYGGMENPCVTFVTPTLLAGDRSLANVIAHEIAHSWFGNLVTNRNSEHFWLNEGFTVFAERKILGRLEGEKSRQFDSISGWRDLEESVKVLGPTSDLTQLQPNLTGVDPDDAYSRIPYEKGYAFLYYLEEQLGGAAPFEEFLRSYLKTFQFKSINTGIFREFLESHFQAQGKGDLTRGIPWEDWLKGTGLPPYKPEYDGTLLEVATKLKNRWSAWDYKIDKKCPFHQDDLAQMNSKQIVSFLSGLLDDPINILGEVKLRAMEELYKFNSRKNAEIQYIWLRLGIKERWSPVVDLTLTFLTVQGRMKYIRPLYRDLWGWGGEIRQRAIDTFLKNRPSMMYLSATMVAKDLRLDH